MISFSLQQIAARLKPFLKKMKLGKPELGVTINTEKSQSNLNRDSSVSQLLTMSGRTLFSWCGLLIDTSTGEVRIDYSRFAKAKALDSLTVDRCQVGRNLQIRMKTFVRPRCQPILYDSTVNSFEVVVYNFTQMMLLAALKSQENYSVSDRRRQEHWIHSQCY